METKLKSKQIKKYAKRIGVDLIGVAQAVCDKDEEKRLEKFIEKGRHGEMAYLADLKKRINPTLLLENAKSIIVVGINYYRQIGETPPAHGKVARYAYGRDYHKTIKQTLKKIANFIEKEEPNSKNKICVDSNPLPEKYYAVKAGLGFIGKNTTLINPEFGSFILLGEIITTIELEYDKPAEGTCGTCTRCMDACPTKAIIASREIDARKCISYLTIEKKDKIPTKFHKSIGNKIFGCDICQEVCPYNKTFAKPALRESNKIAGSTIPLKEILDIKTDEEFLERFAGSPLMRTKRQGLQRNAKIAQKNTEQEISSKN